VGIESARFGVLKGLELNGSCSRVDDRLNRRDRKKPSLAVESRIQFQNCLGYEDERLTKGER
jgi:hypothetical protein